MGKISSSEVERIFIQTLLTLHVNRINRWNEVEGDASPLAGCEGLLYCVLYHLLGIDIIKFALNDFS